ncbi:MAG TPA: hypothetical protein VE377_21570 [Candidatus Dormibacteraeota bacterium]|nr:hypothetical protein [Candidatus Dormibacteraeota bacterium]
MHCEKCGVEMVPGSAFCASCGQPVRLQPGESGETAVATPGLPSNVAGALCYLAGLITGILFLVLEPYRRDRFVRFHAFQSVFFNVAWVVFYLALGMLQSLAPWKLWHLIATFSTIISLALFCVALSLMYRAYNNERFKLPVIGDLAEKQA